MYFHLHHFVSSVAIVSWLAQRPGPFYRESLSYGEPIVETVQSRFSGIDFPRFTQTEKNTLFHCSHAIDISRFSVVVHLLTFQLLL